MASILKRIPPWIGPAAAAWTGLQSPSVHANGRFPGADQLVVDPGDPEHLVVRATFGFVETRDGGKSWHWICEEAVGQIGTADPSIAVTGDGTLVVAVPFEGLAVSHDHGCSWSRAPAPLAGQLAVDSTLEPNDPSGLLVLTSTNDPQAGADANFEFLSQVVETKDDARTWSIVGTALPRDFIATTVEVARSDPDRIYVGGVVGLPPAPVIERTLDRGKTWSRTMVPVETAVSGLFVSAIDPRDPDRLWVRVLSPSVDAFGTSPTSLKMSGDRGDTWTSIVVTQGGMYGFALSPDGGRVAYGTTNDGVFVGPSDGTGGFALVSAIKNRGLTWSASGLYASATEPVDPFAVGLAKNADASFEPIYLLKSTCPQACPDDSPFNQACRGPWTDPSSGVARLTGATGEACSVAWAQVSGPVDAGFEGTPVTSDAAVGENPPQASRGCSCELGADGNIRSSAPWSVGFVAAVAACLLGIRRRALDRLL
jgi:hypothetical protein